MSRLEPADLARLKDSLTRSLDDWVPRRFPGVARDGALFRMFDRSGGAGTAFVINRTGPRAGSFHDFWASEHGGVIDLWMAALRESDFRKACAEAARYLGDPATLALLESAPTRAARETTDADAAHWKLRLVKRLFLEADALAGSPAEAYLRDERSISVAALPRPPSALRFHPALRCPRWRDTGEMRPGMVAIVTGEAGGQTALHQTFLGQRDGRWTKAPGLASREQKRTLGSVRGGFIPLQRGASGRRWPDMPQGEPVYVTEGIEDGLTVALALPQARVIAALSMGNMGELPIPPSGAGYVLCAQNDAPATLVGFERVRAKLAERCAVIVTRPPAGLKDWNDWARALVTRNPEGGA